jgi:hypothetical protein
MHPGATFYLALVAEDRALVADHVGLFDQPRRPIRPGHSNAPRNLARLTLTLVYLTWLRFPLVVTSSTRLVFLFPLCLWIYLALRSARRQPYAYDEDRG